MRACWTRWCGSSGSWTRPTEARFLTPLITREIVYRLLMGEQGDRLRHIAVLGGNTHRIAGAIERLRQDFDQPLRIEEMARELGMSVSGFHHHFKAVTAMSPLQFQKQLRLQEARRLMLGEHLDAASAGLPRGLRRCLALQPGVQEALRRAADARRGTAAEIHLAKRRSSSRLKQS